MVILVCKGEHGLESFPGRNFSEIMVVFKVFGESFCKNLGEYLVDCLAKRNRGVG